MIDYKLVCLIFLAFGFNTMKSQNINYKTLLGIEHSNLVGDSLRLEKNTFIAFEKMKKAALNDGIQIKVVSGFHIVRKMLPNDTTYCPQTCRLSYLDPIPLQVGRRTF